MINFCAKDIVLSPIIESATLTKITDKEYFSSEYSNYVSNSKLGLINPLQGGSFEKFDAGFGNNIITSDSLIIGTAVHTQILQKELFTICKDFERPTAKLGYVSDFCYEASKDGQMVDDDTLSSIAKKCDYYGGDLSKFSKYKETISDYIRNRYNYEKTLPEGVEGIYLHNRQQGLVENCIRSLESNPDVQNLLHPVDICDEPLLSYNENAILMDVEAKFKDGVKQILHLKAKLDNFTLDEFTGSAVINDVKTTSKPCSEFQNGFNLFHYYREFGMYGLLLMSYLKNQQTPYTQLSGNCLVVETTGLNSSCVFPVSSGMFSRGVLEAAYLLKLVAYHQRYGSEAIQSK